MMLSCHKRFNESSEAISRQAKPILCALYLCHLMINSNDILCFQFTPIIISYLHNYFSVSVAHRRGYGVFRGRPSHPAVRSLSLLLCHSGQSYNYHISLSHDVFTSTDYPNRRVMRRRPAFISPPWRQCKTNASCCPLKRSL